MPESLLGATDAPSGGGRAAVGAARVPDGSRAEITVGESDVSSARDDIGPGILAGTGLSVAEAAVVVGPLQCALG